MTMGTRPGSYTHNMMHLKPGGASQGFLFSRFNIYNAKSESEHELKIQFQSSGDSFFNGGNVGIGTDDPNSKLVIKNGEEAISITGTSIGFNRNVSGGQIFNEDRPGWQINAESDKFRLSGFNGAATNAFTILNNGNFGINTTSPKNKLSVNGTIWATKVKVTLTDAADWVFDDTYKLRSLSEVASFIEQNKHLPEIPSADEFRANDMEVSEMTNKLLQKIEELTLYTIAQEKEIQKLKDSKNSQDQKIELLIKRLEALEVK